MCWARGGGGGGAECEVGPHKIGESASFHVYENKVYCPSHFEELFLQKCAECGKMIQGQYVKVLDQHFHTECWKCSTCKASITSGQVITHHTTPPHHTPSPSHHITLSDCPLTHRLVNGRSHSYTETALKKTANFIVKTVSVLHRLRRHPPVQRQPLPARPNLLRLRPVHPVRLTRNLLLRNIRRRAREQKPPPLWQVQTLKSLNRLCRK